MISLKKLIEEIEENKGLWANIHAKRKRGEKPAKKGSEAYKKAKAAGKKISKKESAAPCGCGCGDKIQEAEYQGRKVKLNQVSRGGDKKFFVYVKDGDKVKKVSFGAEGMAIKTKDPDRRRNFRARHNCDNPGPKTKARYWSCRMWSGPNAVKNMLKK